jgi:hypothetical protein
MIVFPIFTGQAARLLRVAERRLHEAVRLGVVCPAIVSGRRLWRPDEVLAAAKWLGLDTPEVRNACQTVPPAAAGREGGAR